MSLKIKTLIGVVVVLVFTGLAFWICKYRKQQTLSSLPSDQEEICVKAETEEEMSLSEAKEIALGSECVEEGSLTGEYFCNESTGTWWLDLDIQKEGCAPACVIDVSTGKAEINWRCTGVIVP